MTDFSAGDIVVSRISLSHSSADNAPAIALRDWLVAEGWNELFLDLDPERGIAAGERWERALNEAARRCEAVLFLISKAWLASRWCMNELTLARRLNKRLFGVLIEEGLAVGDLPGDVTSKWQVVNLAAGSDHRQFPVTLPVTGELATPTFSIEGLARLKGGLQRAGLQASFFNWPPENDPKRPPYRGLRPLEAEDAGIFFGRESPIIEAIDRLRGLSEGTPPRLFVILGASGAGKSSFLRAGLLPRLACDDQTFLPLPIIRPERAAITGETGLLRSLKDAFEKAELDTPRAALRAAIDGGAAKLKAYLNVLVDRVTPIAGGQAKPKPPALILAIDQGEELFLAEAQDEAQPFLHLLRELLINDAPSVIATFTIRSDNYERLQEAKQLDGVHQEMLNLPPIPKGSYAEVIKGPARRLEGTARAFHIDDALVEALLGDIEAGGAKDALPLLAFTLERLYGEYHASGGLKFSHYDALGRIKGSIEAAVKGAFKAADANQKIPRDYEARLNLLRRGLIPWLAGIDPDTGAPRRRVARLSEIPAESRPLVDLLVEQRLLATDLAKDTGERTIEPVHEALLRQWGLLQGWLSEDAGLLSVMDGVKRATRDWAANGKSAAWLTHAAERLQAAQRLADRPDLAANLEPTDREYLAACLADEIERINRQRRIVGRAFVNPVEQALAKGFDDRALRVMAAGAVLADDPNFALVPELWAAGATAIGESRCRCVLCGHERTLGSVTFSPDGGRLATASEDGTARVWDAQTGREFHLLAGHQMAVNSVTFSSDGRWLLTASSDATARVWDAESGQELLILRGHAKSVNSAVFSPDNRRVVTASHDPIGAVRIWNIEAGKEIAVLRGHRKFVWRATFSPDGRQVVTASEDGTARVWNAESGTQIAVLRHVDPVWSAAFSPDGRRIVTASADHTAILWDVNQGTQVAHLQLHLKRVNAAAFSPDSRRVATASADATARLWDAENGRAVAGLYGHEGEVLSVAFSPDGRRVVTASADASARLWDAENGKEIAILRGHERSVNKAAFSPDGRLVATSSLDGTARVWTAERGKEIVVFKGHEGTVYSAAFSPNGNRIVTASSDWTVRLWNTDDGKEVALLEGHRGVVRHAAFSPDGQRVVTASADHTARLWDADSGKEIFCRRIHSGTVWSAAFSPNGRLVVTASRDRTAQIWEIENGREIAVLRHATAFPRGASFNPDGRSVLSAHSDCTARIWDVETGKEISVLSGHEGEVWSAAFSPDGGRVVTASQDRTARVWDAESGKVIALLKGHLGDVTSASFSPDSQWVVTTSSDCTVRLWDAQRGTEMGRLMGHDAHVRSAAFSHDGLRVLTSSSDRTARLWDVSRTVVFTGDRSVLMAAGLARLGRRTPTERLDLLLQDAPDDLFVALMKKLPGQAEAVSKTIAALAAPLHPNCYLSPTGLAELFRNRTRERRVGRIAIVAGLVVGALAAIAFFNRTGLLNMRKLMDLLNWTLLW